MNLLMFKAVCEQRPVAWGNQHLASGNLKKILVTQLCTRLSCLPFSAGVKRVTDCKILCSLLISSLQLTVATKNSNPLSKTTELLNALIGQTVVRTAIKASQLLRYNINWKYEK